VSISILADREALRPAYRHIVQSGKRTRYVSGSGSDSSAGTSDAPFATIQHALDTALPGDRILVRDGTYGYTQLYGFTGSEYAWLSVEAEPGQHPIIDVSNATHASGDGIDIQLSSYVGFFGFEIKASQTQSNSDASAIGVFRRSHHIVNWAHNLHDFPGGGVNHFYIKAGSSGGYPLPEGGWDIVDASFNTIHACCKYSEYNTSGISFYGAIDYTHGTWDGRYAYRAVANYIFDCICTVPYTPGGYDYVTDGNGISVDSLASPNNLYPSLVPYTKSGLCESNVIAACGGRAIHTYNSINLYAPFNSGIGNLRTNSPAINGSVEFDLQLDFSEASPNVRYDGCLIIPLNTPNSTDTDCEYRNCVIAGGTQSVPSNNIDHRSDGTAYSSAAPTLDQLVSGIPIKGFVPTKSDAVDKPDQAVRGRQTLGHGYRAGRGAWAAGALERTSPPKALVSR
jgi:hypothetical protein